MLAASLPSSSKMQGQHATDGNLPQTAITTLFIDEIRSSSIDTVGNSPYNLFLYSPIAQSVERRTVNPQVPGSSPGRGAKFSGLVHKTGPFFFSVCAMTRFNVAYRKHAEEHQSTLFRFAH